MRATSLLIALLAGCDGGTGYDLAVDLKTDLVPGVEFTTIRVTVLRGARQIDRLDRGAFVGDAFVEAQRVAEVRGIATGSYRLQVELLDASGATVVERPVALTLSSDTIVLVVLTRDCRGVMCPQATDTPAETACLGGRCVDPTCLDGTDVEACGTPECAADADCVATAACAEGLCEHGACLFIATDGDCAASEYCLPETGCTALPGADGGTMDAGGRDAGPTPDGGARDAAIPECRSAAECDDGTFCNGAESCIDERCLPGTPVTCDDGIECTVDTCTPAGCTHTPTDGLCPACAGARCDPDIGCQCDTCVPATCLSSGCESAVCMGDICMRTSRCSGTEMCCADACVRAGCDDDNPCTDDSCGLSGCEHTNNTSACSDGSGCTTSDRCAGGLCVPGAPIDCNDFNGCTTDACDAGIGCLHTSRTGAACDDGQECTDPDTCNVSGSCRGTPMAFGTPCGGLCESGGMCGPSGCEGSTIMMCLRDFHCDEATGTCVAD